MQPEASTTPIPFDPLRATAAARIKIFDRPDGGREFVLPALRNFREKMGMSVFWLIMASCLVGTGFISHRVAEEFPAIVRFFIINHTWFLMLFFGAIVLLLTIACIDAWLRSSRIIATNRELQVVTRWLFFKRSVAIPTSKIIEIKSANTTTIGTTRYYDIVVLAIGERKSWLAAHFPAKRKEGSSFTENDLKVFNTGGKKFAAATGIEGEPEAEWLLAQLRAALGVNV